MIDNIGNFYWNNVIWSDETKISNDSNGKQKIWIINDENIITYEHQYPINIYGILMIICNYIMGY